MRKRERKKSSGKRVILLEWCISSDFTNTNACRLLQFDSPISLNHRNSFCLSAVCEMNLKIISINCQHIYSGLVSCDIETRYRTMRCVVMQISLMCFLPRIFTLIETRRISRRIQRNVNSANFHPYIWYIFSIKAALVLRNGLFLNKSCTVPKSRAKFVRRFNKCEGISHTLLTSSLDDGLSLWQMTRRICTLYFVSVLGFYLWYKRFIFGSSAFLFADGMLKFAKAAKIAEWEFMAATSKY